MDPGEYTLFFKLRRFVDKCIWSPPPYHSDEKCVLVHIMFVVNSDEKYTFSIL